MAFSENESHICIQLFFLSFSFFLLNHHYHHHLPLLNAPLLFLTSQGQSRRRSAVQLDRSRLPKENHPPSHLLFLAVSPLRGDTRPSVRRLRPAFRFCSLRPSSNTHRPLLDSRCLPRPRRLQCPCDPRGAQTKLEKKKKKKSKHCISPAASPERLPVVYFSLSAWSVLLSEEWLVFMQCWVVFLLVNKCRLTGTLFIYL